jgi:hypothetical protein
MNKRSRHTIKNPFMSAWLSAFNTAVGTARGHAMAEAKRQATATQKELTKQVIDFWTGKSVTAAAPTKKTKRRR